MYLATFNTIRRLADQGPCVMIGRCADYILKDNPDVLKVFIYADMDFRCERAVRIDGVDPDKAKETVITKNKRRANYYNYHSDFKWGEAFNYNICIDSSRSGIDRAVEIIASLVD